MADTAHLETTTVRLLDAWKARKGIDSDYKAAKELGVAEGTPRNWRHLRSHAAPSLAAKMAKDLGLNELAVLAAIEADRATKEADRRAWQRHGRGVFMALALGVGLSVLPAQQLQAQQLRQGPISAPLTDGNDHYAKCRFLPLCPLASLELFSVTLLVSAP